MTPTQVCDQFQQRFFDSTDLVSVEGTVLSRPAVYLYLAGLTSRHLLEQGFVRPLSCAALDPATDAIDADVLARYAQSSSPIRRVEDLAAACQNVAEGEVVLWVDDAFYMLSLREFDKRAVAEPPTSAVIKGPREGFGEDVGQNISLLRRRIKDPGFVFRRLVVGRVSHTPVVVCYLQGIAQPAIVDEIVARIGRIDIDGVVDSAYIGQMIADNRGSIYSQYFAQEKPDIVAAKLLEGRVAVVVDGSPIVITLPCLLLEGFQNSEDYYRNNKRTTFLRLIRLVGALLAVLLPAAYVAILEYHYQVMPLKFLITVLNATNGVPFPPIFEMLTVLVIFEILNEASVRMPQYVGMALSVVGAIVLGDTAVQAGLLSSPAVLVMALSSIGLYIMPDDIGTLGTMRFAFLVAGGLLGFVGLVGSVLLFVCYTVSLSNFGVDFAAPFAPLVPPDLQDSLYKAPIYCMEHRPYSIPTRNRRRLRRTPQ